MAHDESRKSRIRNFFHRSKGHSRTSSAESSSDSPNVAVNNARSTSGNTPQDRLKTPPQAASNKPIHQPQYTLPEQNKSHPVNTAEAYGDPSFSLPQVPHGRAFSSDFKNLTLSPSRQTPESDQSPDGNLRTRLEEGRNSEHIADRNIAITSQNRSSVLPSSREPRLSASKSQPLIPHVDKHSGNVADWNIVRNDDPAMEARDQAPVPLKVKKRASNLHEATTGSSANGVPDPRGASWTFTPLGMEGNRDDYAFGQTPLNAHLNNTGVNVDKSLPPTPSKKKATSLPQGQTTATEFPPDDLALPGSGPGPVDLEGVDVHHEPDTVSLHEHQAPAITHETIREDRHEIREELITRETHEHQVYHRILPIKDIEVKPARHFVPIQDGYVEVAEEDLPGRTREKTNWAIAEMVSKSQPQAQQAAARGHFSARKFEGTDGDDKQYTSPEGHPVKEQWWVHPPTLQNNTEGTYPFHFGSADPKDDGLRAKLPSGNVIGVSERLMKKREKEALESPVSFAQKA